MTTTTISTFPYKPPKPDDNTPKNEEIIKLLDSYIVKRDIPDFDEYKGVTTTGNTTGVNANYDLWSYSHPTNSFLHVERAFQAVHPGAVLESKVLDDVITGVESTPIKVGTPTNRWNENITIFDHPNARSFKTGFKIGNITEQVSKSLIEAQTWFNDYTIYFEMGTTDNLADFADRLNFNGALLKKLGLVRKPNALLTSINKKILLFFSKPIGTYEAVIESPNENLPNVPFNAFFNKLFSLTDAKSANYWGPKNPPVYIDSVTYGNMVFVVVDYNSNTAELYKKLENGYYGDVYEAQTIIKDMLKPTTTKYYAFGPITSNEIIAIKSSNWLDFFFTVPTDFKKEVYPILYTVKDFTQRRYNVPNVFEYVKIGVRPIPKVNHNYKIRLTNIIHFAPVILKVYDLKDNLILNLAFWCDVTFDLTPYLNDPKMKVVIRPTVGTGGSGCGCHRQRVTAAFITDNGTPDVRLRIDCAGPECKEFDVGTYIIDKDANTIKSA